MLHGELAGGVVAYAAGLFDGAPDGGSVDLDAERRQGRGRPPVPVALQAREVAAQGPGLRDRRDDRQAVGRPHRPTGRADRSASSRSVAGLTADGTRNRLSPQLSFYSGAVRPDGGVRLVGVVGEEGLDRARGRSSGARRGRRPPPSPSPASRRPTPACARARPSSPARGSGAPSSSRRASTASRSGPRPSRRGSSTPRSPCGRPSPGRVGLNWYLSRNIKQVVDFERTTFTGGAEGGATARPRTPSSSAPRSPSERERTSHDPREPHPRHPGPDRPPRPRRGSAPRPGAPQRLLRPDARALPGVQRRLRRSTGRRRPGKTVTIKQSHGGSGKQARAVIDGLEADVVTLALAYDIDAIAEKAELVAAGLAEAPAAQQLRPTPRPSSSSSARGTRRASRTGTTWCKPGVSGHHAESRRPPAARAGTTWPPGRCGAEAAGRQRRRRRKEFVDQLFKNVPGARLRRARLDDHLRAARASATCCSPGRTRPSWRSRSSGRTSSRSSCPSLSILAEPPVAVVDKVVDKHGTRDGGRRPTSSTSTRPRARRSPRKHYYRPRDRRRPREVRRRSFPTVKLFTIDEVFGGWAEGAEGPLRRRRHLRPDLPAGRSQARRMPSGGRDRMTPMRVDDAQRAAGLRPDAGVHAPLPEPDRADPARRRSS